jgi:hypothetical protein
MPSDTVPRIQARGTIRVQLPAKVAYSPDALKKSIGNLLERLGCPKCFSGADCLFHLERDFLLDAKGALDANAVAGPQPLPWLAASTVQVSLARGARFNIDKVFKAVDSVIQVIGACPCHSGFDVLYLNEIQVIGVNEKAEAQRFGG